MTNNMFAQIRELILTYNEKHRTQLSGIFLVLPFSLILIGFTTMSYSQTDSIQINSAVSILDYDGDGVFNDLDNCNLDPNKSEQGACGCGIADDGDCAPNLNQGDILAIDQATNLLYQVDPITGVREVFSDFNDPSQGPVASTTVDINIDQSANIYVVSTDSPTVAGGLYKVDRNTRNRTLLSDFSSPIQGPTGANAIEVTVDNSGNLYVLDSEAGGSGQIFQINPTTGLRTVIHDFSDSDLGTTAIKPIGITIEDTGNFLITDESQSLLFRIDKDTNNRTVLTNLISDMPSTPVGAPDGIDTDLLGNIFLVALDPDAPENAAIPSIDPTTGSYSILVNPNQLTYIDLTIEPNRNLLVTGFTNDTQKPLLDRLGQNSSINTLSDFSNPAQGTVGFNPNGVIVFTFPDRDGDGIPDPIDNCPDVINQDQADFDNDGTGDFCEPLILNPILPGLFNNVNSMTVEQAISNKRVAFVWGFRPGSFIVSGATCSGIELGIRPLKLLGIVQAGPDQIANFQVYIPGSLPNLIFTQAIDITTCRTSDVVQQIVQSN